MNCDIAPYTEKINDKCYIPCKKGYRADGDICDKIDIPTHVHRQVRDPVRSRRKTICDPGHTWDGYQMCYPTCPAGFETRDETCVSVPHAYRRKPRPKLFTALLANARIPDVSVQADKKDESSTFQSVIGESIGDAKELIRQLYPESIFVSISVVKKEQWKKKNTKKVPNRFVLFYDPHTGLIKEMLTFR